MAQQASPEATILALEKKWTDAYKLRNISLMTSMLADDFIITVEDGNIYGKMGYMAHTADTSTQVDVAEESDLKVRMHGTVAVVTGAYHETGSSKGKRYEYRDRLTDVWMKIDGQWRLIAAQYSVPLAPVSCLCRWNKCRGLTAHRNVSTDRWRHGDDPVPGRSRRKPGLERVYGWPPRSARVLLLKMQGDTGVFHTGRSRTGSACDTHFQTCVA